MCAGVLHTRRGLRFRREEWEIVVAVGDLFDRSDLYLSIDDDDDDDEQAGRRAFVIFLFGFLRMSRKIPKMDISGPTTMMQACLIIF